MMERLTSCDELELAKRFDCLKMTIESRSLGETPDQVVRRADAYLEFVNRAPGELEGLRA